MKTKMKTRCISLLLCLVMVLGLLPMPTMAAEVAASGTSGNAEWTLEDGVFTISGGAMANYASAEEQPWHAYAAQIQKVVIGSGVIRVGDYAFADCVNLTEVEIGEDVDTIGAYAFENTTSLTEVKMPKNVKVFCNGMFHNSGLKKLYVYSRYTEFDGFYSVGYDEDNVLPLDTVIYCYACSHAYFYFNRDTVIFTDDLLIDVDNGNSALDMSIEHPYYVRDLWAAADTADGLVFDYTASMKTADIVRIHNEMVEENQKIGLDYDNNGKLEVEVQISLRNDWDTLATIRAGANYSFFEYNLEYEPNNNYGTWGGWSNEEQFITVNGDADSVTVNINATMQELEAYAGEPISDVFLYVSVKGISHKYNFSYGGYETVNKTTTVESCGTSIYDAHLRESGIAWGEDRVEMLTLDYAFVVEDWAPDGGLSEEEYAKYYEPVSRHYEWNYRIGREGWFYDEETEMDICPGQGFWELDEGMFTEEYNGVLYGGVAGHYDAGSDASVSLREMLPDDQFAFVETLRGVEASGLGGEARIDLWYTLTVTYADGSVVVLEGGAADETTSIVGVCLHTCAVCGLCTSEELLSCNSRYGWRTNACLCENPSPAIEYSAVGDAVVIPEESYCYYGEVTARVETFDTELAVTTDYFKAIVNSVGYSNVAAVYDITLYNEGGEPIAINEWGGTEEYVTLSIPVSAEIALAAANGELVLYHVDKNGVAELVSFTVDTENNTFTFTGYEFSPYVLVEVVPYYGRTQLATMPNSVALLYAYDQIAAGVEASAESIEVYNGVDALSKDELTMVMEVYRRDYAHHFWLGNGYSYSSTSTTVVSVIPTYILSGAELETAKAAFEEKVDEILAGLTLNMTEFERELYLHDKLAGMITYEFADNAHNAYGAIVEGKAVCEGYAEALQYLLQRAGIQSFIAIGTSINPGSGSAENHAWNYVRIDGRYYHVDLTWNDQGEDLYHAYFNQTDAVIQEDHAISACDYALPVCNDTAAQYFTGKDTYLDSYSADVLGQLLKNNGMKVHVYIPGSVNDFINWYYANISSIAASAEVSGAFSYGYQRLGRELILILNVAACTHTDLTLRPATDATCTVDGHKAYYECACGKYFADETASVEISNLEAWKVGEGKIAALGHEYGQWFVVDEASCTENGLERRDCQRCEYYETRVVEATGHDYASVLTEPTCTEQGYTTHTCANCGDSYVDTYTASLGHDWDEGVVTIEPTEATEGQRLYTCQRCGVTRTETIPKVDHVHSYEAVVTTPTCTEQGYTTYTCRCGDSYVDNYVPANGHDYDAVDTEPTCTEEGYTVYTCVNCGDTYTGDYVDARGHSFGEWFVVNEATCTEDGQKRRDCANCDRYEIETIDATGHNYDSVVTEPTCTGEGYTTHTCASCGDSYVDGHTEALGHAWDEGVVTIEPTEGTDGQRLYTCQTCGETKEEVIPSLNHVHSYEAVVTAPTCTEQGYTTYTCRCGDSYVDTYVPATGHSYGAWYVIDEATCTETGLERRDCENCDHYETEVISATGHDYDSVVTEPTCTEDGYITYTCHCGDSYNEVIEATGHSYVDGVCEHCGKADPDAPVVLMGDANGDGVVNYLDAMLIAQYYVGAISDEDLNLNAADVNGDGVINYLDAMMVAQFYVGYIDSFPAKN